MMENLFCLIFHCHITRFTVEMVRRIKNFKMTGKGNGGKLNKFRRET
jgi:hypothetical protein